MARTMEIPAVLGVTDILKSIKNNELIGLDGSTGDVEIAPKEPDV
jgi:phosphotransferase system enzyme I (PtsI)